MKVYRKTSTVHPICIYLTDAEAERLYGELDDERAGADWSHQPLTSRLLDALQRKGWAKPHA